MRSIRMKRILKNRPSGNSSEAEDLKNLIRDSLLGMARGEQKDFIQALESEMEQSGLTIRQYLIPLGIPALRVEDLTPTEIGHLVRFLKINIPTALPAVEKAMARFGILTEKLRNSDHIMAA